MRYTVEYTPRAVEDLKALSPQAANLVYSWVEKNLEGCEDPRSQGKGRRRGGRWRYKLGAYRLVCEIMENRIIILGITSEVEDTVSGHDRRGQVKRRAPSVFLKSTARQPVKAAALLIVTALLTFAFVSRGAEWLLIRQETERLEGYYQAVGGISDPGSVRDPYSLELEQKRDASEAIRYLEENPYVEWVDVYREVSAVLPEYPNGGFSDGWLGYENSHEYVEDVLFYGTLTNIDSYRSTAGQLAGDYSFLFQVDEVVVGEEMIQAGYQAVLINPRDYRTRTGIRVGEGETVDHFAYVDLTFLAQELELGGRYLLRGSLDTSKPGVMRGSFESGDEATPFLQFKPLVEGGPWYLPAAEGAEADFSNPQIAGLMEEMKLYDDNQHSATVGVARDMSALASTPDWVEAQAHLVEGRWLTAEDTELERPVCVVPVWLGAAVGDTVTMKLRDVTVRMESFMNFQAAWYGYLYRDEDLSRLDEIERTSVTVDFEVAGVYDIVNHTTDTAGLGYPFIPASFVPESFKRNPAAPGDSMVSFSLTGPDVQDAFLAGSREDLAALGFQAVMPESGWTAFQAAAGPMGQSSLYNALVFAAVLTAGLAIVTVVYFYMRRKELPIARAMGLPARTCVRQVVTPILLLAGAPGVALGALFGWWWTAQNAGDTLSALAEFGAIDPSALPGTYLAALAGTALALLSGMTLLGAVVMVRRPVLELLQGAARAAVAETAAGTAEPSPFTAPVQAAEAVHVRPAPERRKKLGLRAGLTIRFVWRQASRARLRTALTILLAAGFTVGLAAIQLAIAGSQDRIDWLYEHTPVEAELVRTGSTAIRRETAQALKDSGYITDFYLEAGVPVGGYASYDASQESAALYLGKGEGLRRSLLGFADERTFLSAAGSGSGVAITYHEGWNGSLFAQDWASGDLMPVVVPKALYDELELGPGGKLLVFARSRRPCEVAGYYEGACGGDHPEPLLLPLSACQALCNGRLSYTKAHVTLDPSMNRQLDAFETALAEVSSRYSSLRAVIWDEELRQAVAPLEGSIQLMRVLYPVTLVLSLLCAAGVAVLFIMTSAKEAAILRVQGTTKLRTQVILGLQQALTCFAGLVMGLVGVLLYVGSARPSMLAGITAGSVLCALGYLLAAVAGSVASASVVTGKHPLEMLQVKE